MRKINFTIRHKKKIGLIVYFIIFIFFLTAFQTVKVKAVDDNYSTYLYNQNINVDNDKAHLLSENSDGSNSYRNLFQSNFLFPAKLQNNMLSTGQTSTFSHYSFNQFYFDNLDNKYAYQSNNNSENYETSLIPNNNDFIVNNGSNIINGSLNYQDSEFGKYNATYSFDNYQETKSNFGYYYGSPDNFNNEIIGNITSANQNNWIDDLTLPNGCTSALESEINGHKKVIRLSHDGGISDPIIIHNLIDDESITATIEFWWGISDATMDCRTQFRTGSGGGGVGVYIRILNDKYEYIDDNGTNEVSAIPLDNILDLHKIEFDCISDTYTWSINDVVQDVNINFQTIRDNLGYIRIQSISNAVYSQYFDGYGNINDINYNENDNTNAYGIQSELENDFEINYNYGNSISIMDNLDYRDNVINLTDNSNLANFNLVDSFNKDNGIIELSIKLVQTDKTFTIIIQDNIYSDSIFLRYQTDGILAYYDGFSYIFIDSYLSNIWYNIKVKFNCNSHWNITINDLFYGNYDFRGSPLEMDSLNLQTHSTNYDYSCYLNNIDYSWSNGYYENRITELIPLNDSNYSMYKSESYYSECEKSVILIPNSDIQTQWSFPPTGNHYERIDNYPNLETGTDISASSTDANQYEQFGFNGSVNYGKIFNRLRISMNVLLYMGAMNDDVRLNLYNGTHWTGLHLISIGSVINTWKYYDYAVYNLTDLSNIKLQIEAPSGIEVGWGFEVNELYIKAYYYDLKLELEVETDIMFPNLAIPVLNTIHYSYCTNININISLYIYNYDIESYYLIKKGIKVFDFESNSFILNESAYFRLNKFKLKIESELITLDFNLFIDKLAFNSTYVIQDNNGFQEILIYNHRYDISDVYKGYTLFEFRIYNNSIKYRYSEINFETDDYIYSWIEYNITNIDVKNIEIQSHCRYGLNTLDIEIINFYYLIYINYDLDNIIEFREQTRKELTVQKIKSSFNYTSHTKNYLNITGIIGNYSYNCFNGMRSLYGSTSEIFHRYFNIPYFSQDIDVGIPLELPDGSSSNPSEPTPLTDYYWTYESFETEYYQTVDINIGNWTVEFRNMRSKSITAKYYYQPNSVERDDLGSWKWKIKFSDTFSYTIDFNFMRNAITSIINLVLLFAQWIMYLVVGGLSYIFMYLGTTILVFLWNFLIFYLFTALIYVLWYIYEGLYTLLLYIWEGLVWVYENLLIPFLYWFWEYGVPLIIDWLIIILAHIITIVIWMITLGKGNYDDIYDNVYTMLRYIADEIIQMIITFLNNFEYIILFILYYLLLTGLVYVRYLYCKARGFNNRAEQLKQAFDVFFIPIQLTLYLFKTTKDLVDPYTS